jgi:APA family basic amino acid/polyamine antiporter
MSVLVIVSTFGFLNLALMTAPRVYYAMARDGLFFSTVARVSPRSHVPVFAIALQGVLAAAFALTNTYNQLVGYAVFGDWIYFGLAGIALLVFRRTRPDAPRPYRAPLYPVLPLAFAIAGFGIVINTFVTGLRNALIGSAIIALGVPVFFAWRRWVAPVTASDRP